MWIQRRSWASWNLCGLSILLAVLSLATACPDYRHFEPYAGSPWAAEALDWKFRHPFAKIPVSDFALQAREGEQGIAEQLEKRSYRVSIPAVGNVLRSGVRTALTAQQAGAVIFLAIFLLVSREALGDPTSALFAGVMAATSFVGQWGFNDFTNFDGFAYLVLLLSLWNQSVIGLAVLTVFGGFCDERVILAAPLVWLWHAVRERGHSGIGRVGDLMRPNGAQVGLIFGLVAFSGLRWWLGEHFGEIASTSGMSLGVVKNNVLWLPLALACGLKGGVILFVAAGLGLLIHRRTGLLTWGVLALLPGLCASIWVYDLTRSLAFGFPAFFLAMAVLRQAFGVQEVRRLLFCAALGCLAFPTYWILLRVHWLLPVVRWL